MISRFSEDIDITIFRDDLGEAATVDELEALSGKKRRRRLDAIKGASQAYVNEPMRLQVEGHLREALETAGLEAGAGRVEPDPGDPDRQSLLIWYPKVTDADEGYVRPAVKIEFGAKSALDPNQPAIVKPYVADVLADLELSVPDVRTVVAERTFWDKVVILHGLRQWFDARGALRGGGERISRHYYDVYRLLGSDVGRAASRDFALGVDCVRHARMFFNSPDLNLAAAEPGSFTLSPSAQMTTELARDYAAMAGMIFGRAPALDEVLGRVAELEARVNQAGTKSAAASQVRTGGAGA